MSMAGNPLVQVKIRDGFDPQSGPFTEEIWAGDKDSIYGMTGEIDKAYSWDIDHDGPQYTIKIRKPKDSSGTGEVPVDEIRLHANRATVGLMEAPGFKLVSVQDRQKILRQLHNPDDTFSVGDLGFNGADSLYYLMSAGNQHYQISQPVLVRTRVASATFDFSGVSSSAYVGVGRIVPPGNIAADAALPNPSLFTLPSDSSWFVDDTGIVYAYGWYKHYPEYTQAAGNKAIFTQEWDYGRWPIYGNDPFQNGYLILLADYVGPPHSP